MSLNVRISGFTDEVSESLDDQIALLKEIHESYMCPRVIDHKNIAEYTLEEFVENIKPRLDKEGIKFSSIGSPIGKIDWNDEEGFIRQKKQLKELVKIAQVMGCKYIRIFSFYYGDTDPEETFPTVIRKLKEFLEIAKDSGVTLMHENEKLIYGDKYERVVKIINELRPFGLKLVFDASNYVQCSSNIIDAFNATIADTVYIHIKDCSKWNVEVPVGFGEGNYPYIIKSLFLRDYDGFMTLEPHTWKFAENKKRVYEENIRIGEDSDMFNAFKLIDNKLGLKEDEYLSRKDVYILQYNNLVNLIKEYAK
jgi:sugar phosphate isomerase/epimerase